MRKLRDVINQILRVIPSTEEDIINEFNRILDSLNYSAPELEYMWWDESHRVILDCIADNNFTDWKLEIVSIFSTKSIEEVKTIFNLD